MHTKVKVMFQCIDGGGLAGTWTSQLGQLGQTVSSFRSIASLLYYSGLGHSLAGTRPIQPILFAVFQGHDVTYKAIQAELKQAAGFPPKTC